MKKALEALRKKIELCTAEGERHLTGVPGLSLFRREEPTEPISSFYQPSICLIVQGKKRVMVGEEVYEYDPSTYLLTSVHLPTIVQVMEASPEKPYLGLRLTFDKQQLLELMVDGHLPPPKSKHSSRGMGTSKMTVPLLNAFLRLVELLDTEEDIPILGGVIEWLKDNFAEDFRLADLAERFHMSSSTLHSHFREITSLSPVQFQKQLRLREARRLMLIDCMDATTAVFEVGYESPSQFSREHSRLFGAPPLRDVKNLRTQMTDG